VEVAIERADRDAGLGRDLRRADRVVALLREQLGRRVEQRLMAAPRPLLAEIGIRGLGEDRLRRTLASHHETSRMPLTALAAKPKMKWVSFMVNTAEKLAGPSIETLEALLDVTYVWGYQDTREKLRDLYDK